MCRPPGCPPRLFTDSLPPSPVACCVHAVIGLRADGPVLSPGAYSAHLEGPLGALAGRVPGRGSWCHGWGSPVLRRSGAELPR